MELTIRCARSTDSGASFKGPVSIDGYDGVTGFTKQMESKDSCELATAETAEGEVITLVRPCYGHSPWMWTSRSKDAGLSFTCVLTCFSQTVYIICMKNGTD